jgi:hypothetical protein
MALAALCGLAAAFDDRAFPGRVNIGVRAGGLEVGSTFLDRDLQVIPGLFGR